ncbi:MAG: ATP-binding protein [Desulfobacteraceae bacterium]|nr:ATP-binding protein [Desulfobacteraceae bacterium]
MKIGPLKKHLSANYPDDRNMNFLWIKSAIYLRRHIEGFGINEDALTLTCPIVGGQGCHLLANLLLTGLSETAKDEFEAELDGIDIGGLTDAPPDCAPSMACIKNLDLNDVDQALMKKIQRARNRVSINTPGAGDIHELADLLFRMLKRVPSKMKRRFTAVLKSMLDDSTRLRKVRGKCELEKNIDQLSRIFNFQPEDREFLVFAFLLNCHGPSEELFSGELHCTEYSGRVFLLNILGLSNSALLQCIHKFDQLGLIKFQHDGEFLIQESTVRFLQNSQGRSISKYFYRKVSPKSVPLSNHLRLHDQVPYVVRLLQCQTQTPKHILLYGPPGTGKTSFSYGVAAKIKMPAYEVAHDEDNESKSRRTALMACMKMTSVGSKALIIVDEADNLLNTRGSWFSRGETQDKGWLNRVLEEPGARVLWITNSIDAIDASVLRRFTFSIGFEPFNRLQRTQVWRNVLRNNNVRMALPSEDIERLAKRYRVSAGVIDLAVKTARETFSQAKDEFLKAVETLLEAKLKLQNNGAPITESKFIEEAAYSIEGLNTNRDPAELMTILARFDGCLRSEPNKRCNLNLLLYGPPGTGKSAFARHLANHVSREIVCKRMSDLQSMWVGAGEKNITEAFEEAEREEAVLVIDEADSVLFSRDRALRSWEISFTNEFLTRMEHHRGILICTTNRLNDLDEASMRRFRYKVGFDYLEPDGNVVFYQKLLGAMVPRPMDATSLSDLRRIENLAPGDFKNVRDRHAFGDDQPLSHQVLVADLAQEANLKIQHGTGRKVGFR